MAHEAQHQPDFIELEWSDSSKCHARAAKVRTVLQQAQNRGRGSPVQEGIKQGIEDE